MTRDADISKSRGRTSEDTQTLSFGRGRLRPTGGTSIIVFRQDELFRGLFTPSSTLEALDKYGQSRPDNRLIVLDRVDYGILNPLLGFFFPLQKRFEVDLLTDSSFVPRLYDAQLLDLDADGASEVVVTWLQYWGGSGGNLIVGVVSNTNGEYELSDFVPSYDAITRDELASRRTSIRESARVSAALHARLKENPAFGQKDSGSGFSPREIATQLQEDLPGMQAELERRTAILDAAQADEPNLNFVLTVDPITVTLRENGHDRSVGVPVLHTDEFYKFRKLGVDENLRLITAVPVGDRDCHWCPHSWIVVVYAFEGTKFATDPAFGMFRISRSRGWGLAAVHGYGFQPTMGMIFPFWKPSWLVLPSNEDAEFKARIRSVIVDTLMHLSPVR